MFKTRQVKSCSIGSGARPFCDLTPDCDAQFFAITKNLDDPNRHVTLVTALTKKRMEKGLEGARRCKMLIEYISAEQVDTSFWDQLENLYTPEQLR